jgi:hypothetical protein
MRHHEFTLQRTADPDIDSNLQSELHRNQTAPPDFETAAP